MIDKIVEETLKDTPLKVYFEGKPYESVDIYEDTKDRISHALKQFAEVIKSRIQKLPVYMKVTGGDLKQDKEAVLLDDIFAFLSNLEDKNGEIWEDGWSFGINKVKEMVEDYNVNMGGELDGLVEKISKLQIPISPAEQKKEVEKARKRIAKTQKMLEKNGTFTFYNSNGI